MDGNKEEAEHCVRIARAAIDSGNLVRARRLLLKAQRLYPSPEIQELLSSQFENEDVEPIFSRFSSTSSSTGHSVAQPENAEASTQSASASEPSEDQVEIVRRVKRTVDYYAILGLETGCSEEEVKKAYRKLSLKVHPDKNKAPGAEEAFKLVSRAFQCLSDPELRLRYDRYGPEEARRLSHDTGMRQRRHNDVFFEEFDPNEIFQSFFFGGQGFQNGGPSFQFRRAYVRSQNRGRDFGVHAAEVRPGNMLMFVQLLSIIVLFFISYFPYSQPIYSLEMKDSYKFAKITKDHGVNYYVNSATFDRDYPPDSRPRMQIERQAERDYKGILVQKCRAEMNLHYFGRIKEMPNCVKLEEFPKVF